MTFKIDSGWVVQAVDTCTCGMGRNSPYGHEAFCGLEQECPVEEFDAWVKHMWSKAREEQKSEWQQVLSDVVKRSERETLLTAREALLEVPNAEWALSPVAAVMGVLDTLLERTAGVQTTVQERAADACRWGVTTGDGKEHRCTTEGAHTSHTFDRIFTVGSGVVTLTNMGERS